MGPELLAWKRPFLVVTAAEVIEQVAALRPAWIVSSYVLSQVAPQDVDEYLANLAKLMEGGGRAILQVRLAWRTMKYSKTGWYHCRSRMTRRLAKRGLVVLQTRTRELTSRPHKVSGVEARLILRKEHGSPSAYERRNKRPILRRFFQRFNNDIHHRGRS